MDSSADTGNVGARLGDTPDMRLMRTRLQTCWTWSSRLLVGECLFRDAEDWGCFELYLFGCLGAGDALFLYHAT